MDISQLVLGKQGKATCDSGIRLENEQQKLELALLQRTFFLKYGEPIVLIKFNAQGIFFIGVQIAALLEKEPSNIYRSLKRAGIGVDRASPAVVAWINTFGFVHINKTQSITLVPVDRFLNYLATGTLCLGLQILIVLMFSFSDKTVERTIKNSL